LSYELLALFSSAFISATLFPGGSELLLIYYLNNNPADPWVYFFVVTLGNSLGALVTYFMGYYFYWGRKAAKSKQQNAWLFCQRYGSPALLLSWLPIVGDLLPLAAGWLKLPIARSVLLIVSGKALRYGVIICTTMYLL
jgi:membrane protein YqaA with SNARE-associated domain